MAAFVDKNPSNGLETWVDGDESNRLQVHYRQDVEPVLEYAKILRNDSLTDKGIKNDWWLYAVFPPVVILEFKHKYGIDIFNKNHMKRAFEILNRDYPHLKTTSKRHTLNQ